MAMFKRKQAVKTPVVTINKPPPATAEPIESKPVVSEPVNMVYQVAVDKNGNPVKTKTPNSYIIRYSRGRYIGKWEEIADPIGIPRRRNGRWVYLFTAHPLVNIKTGEIYEELRPLIPQEQIKVLPDALHRKLNKWWSYKKVMSEALKPTTLEKLKISLALGFFAISAIILFLIVISLAGD